MMKLHLQNSFHKFREIVFYRVCITRLLCRRKSNMRNYSAL